MAKSLRPAPLAAHVAADAGAHGAALTLRAARPLSVPLSALYLHPLNVRNAELNPPTKEGLTTLAALIDAQGLLSRLKVLAEADASHARTGRFGVVAGGRRWRALHLLVEQGKLSPDAPIDCDEVDEAEALEISLAENVSQEAMHPADEFAAFQALIDEGRTPEDVAKRFGCKVLHVRRRLKLAAVAPELLALYRQHKLGLDEVEALASCDDQDRQRAVWKGLPAYYRNAEGIRSALTEGEVRSTDPRVIFIGLDRYRASGGEVRQDLFTLESYLTDSGLVALIVAEVLEEHAQQLREEGWAWVEVLADWSYQERQRYVEPPRRFRAETPDETARREALEAEDTALEAKLDEADTDVEDSPEFDAMVQRRDQIEAELQAILQARQDVSGLDRSLTGAVVYRDGDKVAIKRGLLTVEAARKLATQAQASGGTLQSASGVTIEPEPVRAEFSERLVMSLTAHHTAAVQACLLAQPQVALAALAHRFALSLLHYGSGDHPLKISLTDSAHALKSVATTLPNSRSGLVLTDEDARWQERLPKDKAQWLAWFLAQPAQVSIDMLVFATARSLNGVSGRFDAKRSGPLAPLSAAVGLDMADWWSPDADTYLGMVPKAKMAEAVAQACGPEAGQEVAALKKAEAIEAAAARLAGKRWLPAPLRGPASAAATTDAATEAATESTGLRPDADE